MLISLQSFEEIEESVYLGQASERSWSHKKVAGK